MLNIHSVPLESVPLLFSSSSLLKYKTLLSLMSDIKGEKSNPLFMPCNLVWARKPDA